MRWKTTAAQVEQRRTTVAANITAGLTYREIAAVLGVSPALVCKDAKVIFERWKVETVSSRAEHVAIENRRLEIALSAIWPRVLKGHLPSIDRLVRIAERRAHLLGLDGMSGEHTSEGTQCVRDLFRQAQDETDAEWNGRCH
jgi:hypothetical protein